MLGLGRLQAWRAVRRKPPSGSAAAAARNRALHQLVDHPVLVRDRFAEALYGDVVRGEMEQGRRDDPLSATVRAMHALRARFFQDQAAAALADGIRQCLALGAGLDGFCLSQTEADWDLLVEVDRAKLLRWKRRALRRYHLAPPATLRFVSADLEHDDWPSRVLDAGLDPRRPLLVNWQGVSQFLSPARTIDTLDGLREFTRGSRVVFDIRRPLASLSAESREQVETIMHGAARRGEPWRGFAEPVWVEQQLRARGFRSVTWIDSLELSRRYLGAETGTLSFPDWLVLSVATF